MDSLWILGSAKDWTNLSFELSSVMSRQHQMVLILWFWFLFLFC
jgi:hypothetical protein